MDFASEYAADEFIEKTEKFRSRLAVLIECRYPNDQI